MLIYNSAAHEGWTINLECVILFQIMSHLTLIENPQDSEMEVFLEKLLKSGIGGGGINIGNTEHMNGSTDGVVLRTPKKDVSPGSQRHLEWPI